MTLQHRYDLLRMFGRVGHPTRPGRAFTEDGRIGKSFVEASGRETTAGQDQNVSWAGS
ncbi:transposase (plasmid) [Embleya sp. NBC_00888]|uniref:hypothetical protein n=1 Tax=Embleya sp. NBC_00888 TaxID=2975960 RepID=UPI002F90F2DC|nr:transposase [Embleya sp. NBC_00888]